MKGMSLARMKFRKWWKVAGKGKGRDSGRPPPVEDPGYQELPQQQQQRYPGDFVHGRDGARDLFFSEDSEDPVEDPIHQEQTSWRSSIAVAASAKHGDHDRSSGKNRKTSGAAFNEWLTRSGFQ